MPERSPSCEKEERKFSSSSSSLTATQYITMAIEVFGLQDKAWSKIDFGSRGRDTYSEDSEMVKLKSTKLTEIVIGVTEVIAKS
jgi:hypothetical protein